MDPNAFQSALAYVETLKYFTIYILMVLEGPVINAAASFAASLGYFNIFIVWILAFLGDLTGDVIYFTIGRLGHHFVIKRYAHLLKEKAVLVHRIRKGLAHHSIKTIIAVKLAPFLAGPGLVVIGMSKISLRKYIIVSVLTIIPMTLAFSLIGFYFGVAFVALYKYLGYATSLVAAAIFLFILLPVGYRWLMKKIFAKEAL